MKKIKIDDCICHSKLKEHSKIRNLILSEIDKTSDGNLNRIDSIYSDNISKFDWPLSDSTERPWIKIFLPVFIDNLKEVISSMGYNRVNINHVWYQQYLEGDTHGWHIHGQHFTGVYYLEFPEGCSKTEICSPYDLKSKIIDVVEGDFIVFPAHYIHRGLPNTKKRKTIISYNFNANGNLIDNKHGLNLDLIREMNPDSFNSMGVT
tara:strand:+ start:108 stop:725 length:618 start_codon:yes stop_codon:yes gene_type:complete